MTDQIKRHEIHGERAWLREFRVSDAEPLWQSLKDPDHISNKLTGTHEQFTREQVEGYVANQVGNPHADRAAFIICPAGDDRAVGEVIINQYDAPNRSASIRIALFDEADFNKGYGTTAMRLMIGYGFERFDLHRLELEVYAFNPRAIRVYEKIGFRREGVRRDALYWDGEYIDAIVMSVLAPEWAAQDQASSTP
ncbi:MAG: GNAT family protein [Chloroflexota bacterium]